MTTDYNFDQATIDSFGDEWNRFNQQNLCSSEAERIFNDYFFVFPWESLPSDAVGFDMGCGTGRWARFVAPRVGHLHCIEPSKAFYVAQNLSREFGNVSVHQATIDTCTLEPSTQDFGYCLGVLHHLPDPLAALKSCVELLKPGAPFLLYVYYDLSNRSPLYRFYWKLADLIRIVVSRSSPLVKLLITDFIACAVYFPLSRLARLLDLMGVCVDGFPLSYYRNLSIYTMRTDSRDRFGTPLEHRFSRTVLSSICEQSGLVRLRFSSCAPYWCVVGNRST